MNLKKLACILTGICIPFLMDWGYIVIWKAIYGPRHPRLDLCSFVLSLALGFFFVRLTTSIHLVVLSCLFIVVGLIEFVSTFYFIGFVYGKWM